MVCRDVVCARDRCAAQHRFSRIEVPKRTEVRGIGKGEFQFWICPCSGTTKSSRTKRTRPAERTPIGWQEEAQSYGVLDPHHHVYSTPLLQARPIHRLRRQAPNPVDRPYHRSKHPSQSSRIRNAVSGRKLGGSDIAAIHIHHRERRRNPVQDTGGVGTGIRKSGSPPAKFWQQGWSNASLLVLRQADE